VLSNAKQEEDRTKIEEQTNYFKIFTEKKNYVYAYEIQYFSNNDMLLITSKITCNI